MSNSPHFDTSFSESIYRQKYAQEGEDWPGTVARVAFNVLDSVGLAESDERTRLQALMERKQFIPGGRYLYASGRDLHQVQNCSLYIAEDTREGWAELTQKVTMALMTGAGVGVWYGDVRPSDSIISRTGGVASGPISLMKIVNEIGRNVMQGGARRSAIWAGLPWWHPDVFHFIRAKDWSQEVRDLKNKDFSFPATLDMTNISVSLDQAFFDAYEGNEWFSPRELDAPNGGSWFEWATMVYDLVVSKMLTTAEPGFTVDVGDNAGEVARNACTEISSRDDSDICNLGSLNMGRFDTKEQFSSAVKDATLFLLAGTVYSDLPHEEVYATREKNRRLGLGLMGIHEWLLKRGKIYGPDEELGEWLEEYARSTGYAHEWADKLGISRPVKTRAIAPNGTIGIIAETTTSAEPIFAAAYKRRVRLSTARGDRTVFEYVVDPTAARLVAQGVEPALIEDAYTLAYDVERRVAFQAWLQQYVDHCISSTVNLPRVMDQADEQREFGEMLINYLPRLRGITCYPDGSRGGQPLTSVPLEYALDKTGVVFESEQDACVGGQCGV